MDQIRDLQHLISEHRAQLGDLIMDLIMADGQIEQRPILAQINVALHTIHHLVALLARQLQAFGETP